ncbi:hypothetical protein B0J17DRAFT_217680 [Rhizoctonia solani]|nr:hypothetical protein B0J17DRAFT_217680 [Rhizoctonia solani]
MYLSSKPTISRNKLWQLTLYFIGCLVSIVILVCGLGFIPKLLSSSAEPKVNSEGGEGNILRLKTDNLNPPCSIDSESCSPSELASSIPYTPACKGDTSEPNFLDELRGERRYFIAPMQLDQGLSEFSIFSLDPGRRMISHTDESLHIHHIDQSFDSVVNFTIGDLAYKWDTLNDTLFVGQPQAGLGTSEFEWSYGQLYSTPEAAKVSVDPQQDANMDTTSLYTLVSPPLTNNSTFSPSDIADDLPTFPETDLFDLPSGVGFFGLSPSQKDIDGWVSRAVSSHQATRDGTKLKCPEAGCTSTSRRPHALKTHLYTHYRIKPFTCDICALSVLTEANLARHIENVHTCPGCDIEGSIPFIKRHKTVCPLTTATLVGSNSRKHGRSRPSLEHEPYPSRGC